MLFGIAGGAGPDLGGAVMCCLVCPGVPLLICLVCVALARDSLPAAGSAVFFPACLGVILAFATLNTHPNPADPEQVAEQSEAWSTVWVSGAIAGAAAISVGIVPLRRVRRWHSRLSSPGPHPWTPDSGDEIIRPN